MKNLLDDWISSKEIITVRRERRRRLSLALSLIGSIFLFIFGVLALSKQHHLLGVILLISMLLGLCNAYLLLVKDKLEQSVVILNCIIFILGLTLLVTGGIDQSGILWIYPIFAINLFINRFWSATLLAGSFLLITSLLLLTPLSQFLQADYSQIVALRFVVTLLALYAICLVALHSEEHAYNLVIKLHNNDIHRLAFYDVLTGLPNRWNFQQNIDRLIKRRQPEHTIALLYIDLDNFKHVNDTYGHDVGDRLLFHFGQQLLEAVRPNDVVTNYDIDNEQFDNAARLAGDEFVVILTELHSPLDANNVAERILNMFKNGFELEGTTYPVYASIGISFCPDDTESPTELLNFADAAMYQAKGNGNNCVEFFTDDIAKVLKQNKAIELGLQLAINSNRFTLLYQPLFCSQTDTIIGIEALLRCHQTELQGYGPDQFIPIAESTGMIKQLDFWVLETSLNDFKVLRESTGFEGNLCVNISGAELLDESFPQKVKALLQRYDIPSSFIELEITETALVPDNPTVLRVLNQFSEQGLSLSLDDFGTGYTSFNQLILYPASSLKIDRSFIKDLFSANETHGKMVKTILNLAKIHKLKVVAEGVETQQQLNYLKQIGCDCIQGYLLSSPVEKEALITLINTNKNSQLK